MRRVHFHVATFRPIPAKVHLLPLTKSVLLLFVLSHSRSLLGEKVIDSKMRDLGLLYSEISLKILSWSHSKLKVYQCTPFALCIHLLVSLLKRI